MCVCVCVCMSPCCHPPCFLQDLPALVRQGDLIPRQLLYGCSYTLAVTGNAGDGDDMKTEAAVGSVKRVVVGGGREPIGSGVAAMKLLWYVMARYLVVHGAPCITSGAAAVGGISPVTWHFDLAEYGGSSSRVASVGSGGAPSLRQSPNCLELPPDPAAHWRRLKDGLVLPLLAATCRAVGLTPPLGLMVLPMELQLAILRRLEARDLAALSCVCTALHHLASEDEIWRPLFDKEFHTNVLSAADTALANSRGYKYVFGRKWLERAERRKRRCFVRQCPCGGPLRWRRSFGRRSCRPDPLEEVRKAFRRLGNRGSCVVRGRRPWGMSYYAGR
ncbi:hypothetical protein Vretifemale_20600 [Volvox reticuliferus]|uniref:F-box domain-containing protein n=1 Tax=Volvox reticuliferus TaxID=1737510 RepID=A0A8J4G046_9CHLO|nr:hypothetical protein Vretifemale_20600 [Volvox reticuliferus]